MKTVTLKQVGYIVYGVADVTLLDGTRGAISMVAYPTKTKEKSEIEAGINDGGYGGTVINGAICDVYTLYENGYKEIDSTMEFGEISEYVAECYENGQY